MWRWWWRRRRSGRIYGVGVRRAAVGHHYLVLVEVAHCDCKKRILFERMGNYFFKMSLTAQLHGQHGGEPYQDETNLDQAGELA